MPLVLLVEDDKDLQELLRTLLEFEGFQVEVVSDGRQAREWIAQHRPSVMLLDWMLPDCDGGAVADHLREVHGDVVPIVLFTADGHVVEKAARVGAYAYIPKPFDSLDDVTDAVQRALAAH